MAAGSRDRPSMLAPRRYPQWRLRFLRYVDTRPNGEALRKCILSGPYKPTTVLVHAIEATDNSPAVPEHTTEMWEAIERLQQSESLNIQDVKTNLFWEFGKFTSRDGESMESYYTRFYKLMKETIRNNLSVTTMQVNVQFLQQFQPEWSRFVMIVKQQHKLDEVSYHKLFDILKQYQNEVNELRTKKLARNVNPLALVTTAEASQDPFYQSSRSHRSQAPSPKPSIPSRSHTTTKHKGKEIAKPITPPSETASEEDSDPEQAQRDKDMQKILALIAKYFKKIYKPTNNNLKTSSNSKNKNVDTTPRYKNDDHSRNALTARNMDILPRNVESRKGLRTPHTTRRRCCCASKLSRVFHCKPSSMIVSNTCLVETDDSNVTPDSAYICEDDIQNEQNDVESDDERVTLANLIANLKLDVDENKKIQKQLKNANTTLAQELKKCKTILSETSKSMGESLSVQDSCLVAFRPSRLSLRSLRHLMTVPLTMTYLNIKHSKDLFRAPTTHDMEIRIQTCLMPLAIKTQSDSLKFVHELKQEMHADLKYVESLKKEIDELQSDTAEFSDMYDVILQEYISKDVMCSYLQSLSNLDALNESQCLYLHKVKECECLAQKLSKQTESVSKKVHSKLLQSFANVEKHLISLEIALQNCKEQTKLVPKANVSEGLSKPVTAQTLPQGAKKAISNTNVLKPRMYRINNRTAHTRAPQFLQTIRNTNPRVSTSTRVNHKPTVSRPQLKSNQSKDKVLPNNSQVKAKKTQVEVHPRIPSVSTKIKSINACKDSLNSKTLNANVVCATCNKCLVDSNHFACVTKMLNDVHARTKKPTVVPIITRKRKSQANKSIATPNKKKVASKSTKQKQQSYFRVLYENINKA
nr:hypothetical protein [Tanacetum cinerariifolium]